MKAFAVVIALSGAILGTAASANDLTEEQVKALEVKCETAREAKLKPLREAEIARCKTEGRNDADYCERYYRDLGNAVRLPNGSFKPRMFDELPECVAAFEARQGLVK
ncbi:MAG TPA: hypothetical protein VIT67_05485 [Povalibacter sp.]